MRGEGRLRFVKLGLFTLCVGAIAAVVTTRMLLRAEWIGVFVAEPSRHASVIEPGEERWLKGQTHAHSWNSGDSETAPDEVLRWYAGRGYEFVVFTDHNAVTVAPSAHGVLAIPGVELTLEPAECEPAPLPGLYCPLHVNALFVDPARQPPYYAGRFERRRVEVYGEAVEAALELGGLPVVNHPNFQWAADLETLAALVGRGAAFIEIANMSCPERAGDAAHPSVEAMWDALLSRGLRVWGLASDDAHEYFDADPKAEHPPRTGGLGFVMVRARRSPDAIRRAMARGDFYSTNGLLLETVKVEDGRYVIEAPEPVTVRFVGEGGATLQESQGTAFAFDLAGVPGPYVRAVARDGQGRVAWTQPVFLR